MIVVRVELWSAVTGDKTELARMHICNVGGDARRRDYSGETFKGRSTRDLDRKVGQRRGGLAGWRSLDLHVWNLVAAMLDGMGYGDPKAKTPPPIDGDTGRRLRIALAELEAAAIPTKCEVFVRSGSNARRLADDIAALIGEAADA